MLYKTHGIVLHYIKYGESSIIAQVYTELFGRVSYVINSVRKKKSAYRLSNFQPLTILEIESFYRAGHNIQRLKEIKRYAPLNHISTDVIKSSIAIFLSEIIYKTLRENESNKQMFDFLIHAIQFLDLMERGVSSFHLVFLIQYSKFLGIYPQIQLNQESQDSSSGKSPELLSDYQLFKNLPEDSRRILAELTGKSFRDLEHIQLKSESRSALLEIMIKFYQYHFENIGQVKSLQVMRELFH